MPPKERRIRSKRERRESAALIHGQIVDMEIQLVEGDAEIASFFDLEDDGDDYVIQLTPKPAPTRRDDSWIVEEALDKGSCYDPYEWRPLDYALGPRERAELREILGEEGADLLTPESPFL